MYPLFQRGNPQLRVFLPNFTIFPVIPSQPQPSNVVTFQCSMEMTKYDVKNYLTKIYKLPVMDVRLEIVMGDVFIAPGDYAQEIQKHDDTKLAYVTMKGMTFKFPNLFPAEKVDRDPQESEEMSNIKNAYKQQVDQHAEMRPTLPSWFSV